MNRREGEEATAVEGEVDPKAGGMKVRGGDGGGDDVGHAAAVQTSAAVETRADGVAVVVVIPVITNSTSMGTRIRAIA